MLNWKKNPAGYLSSCFPSVSGFISARGPQGKCTATGFFTCFKKSPVLLSWWRSCKLAFPPQSPVDEASLPPINFTGLIRDASITHLANLNVRKRKCQPLQAGTHCRVENKQTKKPRRFILPFQGISMPLLQHEVKEVITAAKTDERKKVMLVWGKIAAFWNHANEASRTVWQLPI